MRALPFSIVSAILMLGLNGPAAAQTWTEEGPAPLEKIQASPLNLWQGTGAVQAVAPHPTDPDIVYVATVNGGIWRTDNATASSPTWVPQTTQLASGSMSVIDLDPTDASGNTAIAGHGKTSSYGRIAQDYLGVLYTTDGGANWNYVNGPPAADLFTDFFITGVEARGNILLASVKGSASYCDKIGVFRSTDSGANWTQLDLATNGLPRGSNEAMEGNPADPAVLYSAVNAHGDSCGDAGVNGVYKSTDYGAHWTKISDATMEAPLADTNNSTDIWISASKVTTPYQGLFVSIAPSPPHDVKAVDGIGFYHSTNGGITWETMDGPADMPAGRFNGSVNLHYALVADATNPDYVYVSGTSHRLRGDAGGTPGSQWVTIRDEGTLNDTSPHFDVRDLAFRADGVLIEVEDGGVFGRTHLDTDYMLGDWIAMSGDLGVIESHDIAYDPLSGIIFNGTQDNGSNEQDSPGLLPWTLINYGDGGDVGVDLTEIYDIPDDDPDLGPVQISNRWHSWQGLGSFRRSRRDVNNTDLGSVWPAKLVVSGNTNPAWGFVNPFDVNRVNGERMILAHYGTPPGFYESLDRCETLTEIVSDVRVRYDAIAYGAQGNEDIVYIGSDNGVYVRTAGHPAALNLAFALADIRDVEVDPDDANHAFVNTWTEVYRTENAGATWTNITGNLDSLGHGGMFAVFYMPDPPNDALVIGTQQGAYWARESTHFSEWSKIGGGLPVSMVKDIDRNAADNELIIGTMGYGAWSMAMPIVANWPPVADDDAFTVLSTATAGTVAGTVEARDPENGTLSYAITAGNTGTAFAVNSSSGEITVANNTAMNTNDPFSLTVTVTDDGALTDTATIDITVDSTPPAGDFDELATVTLAGIEYGKVAWGDYDNDGDLDLFVNGFNGGSRYGKLYRQDANSVFTDMGGFSGTSRGSIAWGDYDNDGDLDLLRTGNLSSGYSADVIENNGGSFTNLGEIGLPNVSYSDGVWGDMDSDGDLDIVLTGRKDSVGSGIYLSEVYANNGDGTFSLMGVLPESLNECTVRVGDYDNDGDLDVLLTGETVGGTPTSIVCENNGDGSFSNAGAGLQGVTAASGTWGDYDNDGDLDILLTGWNGTARITKLYNYDDILETFSEITTSLPGVADGVGAWGDYDNNGTLDILLTGTDTGGFPFAAVYENTGGVFSNVTAGLTGVLRGSAAWGDFDGDGKLDLAINGHDGSTPVTKIYTSLTSTANTLPAAPTALSATITGQSVTLSWSAASDAQTPADALSYNVRIATQPGGVDAQAPMAEPANGYRRIVAMGNGQLGTSATVSGFSRCQDYYWSVQAVDSAFAGGPFAADGSFRTTCDFEELPVALDGIDYGKLAWGDYDNDGDLDLLVSGYDAGARVAKVYRRESDNSFTDVGASFTGTSRGSAVWGDYDNDGDLDILQTGNTGSVYSTRIFKNSGGSFSEVSGAGLPPVSYSDAVWGDMDNDGDLDVIVTGRYTSLGSGSNLTAIYENQGNGSFTSMVSLPVGLDETTAAVGDYDNDGDLDVLLTGQLFDGAPVSIVWRNNGGGAFTAFDTWLEGLEEGSGAWGDYDADGDLDVLLMGRNASGRVTRLYENNAGVFTNVVVSLPGLSDGNAAWGDYDNDGLPDILMVGRNDAGNHFARVYHNDDFGNFSEAAANMTGVELGWGVWGDFDGDGKLDVAITGNDGAGVVTKIYQNQVTTANTPPTTPTGLSAVVDGSTVTLSWSPASDGETPAAALTYNLRFGTTPGGIDVTSPMSDLATGFRRVAEMGNGQLETSATISVGCGMTYYWSVQAIDGVFAGSFFSAEGSFTNNDEFCDPGAGFIGLENGSVAWGDYDEDGDLDAVVTGINGSTRYARVYLNNNGSFTTAMDFPGIDSGGAIFGDCNRDGDLDILVFGEEDSGPKTRLFKAYIPSEPFIEDIGHGLEDVADSAAAFGDYDNDGDLDVVLAGRNLSGVLVTKVFEETGTCDFNEVATFQGVRDPAVAWGDYDNDGKLDLVLIGFDDTIRHTIVYHNDGGDGFSIGATLTGVSHGSVAWGDYDFDGDLDLLISGMGDSGPLTTLYRNAGGVFSAVSGTGLPNVEYGEAVFGDMDNDGNLDILITGYDGSQSLSSVYLNNGDETFTALGAGLPSLRDSSAAWGDYDNDNKLDILLSGENGSIPVTHIYRNAQSIGANTAPTAPSNLAASGDGWTFSLSWDAATDSETPQDSLTYNLRIGSTPGGDNLYATMSDAAAGYRRLPAMGLVQHGLSAIISPVSIGCYTVYWSVQAVDAAHAGGPFATDGSFFVCNEDFSQVASLTGVSHGGSAWGDYDNDNDLDLITVGYKGSALSALYRNNGDGGLTDTGQSLRDVYYGDVAWGDYDLDGDIDAIVSGMINGGDRYNQIMRNEGGTLVGGTIFLPGVSDSALAWADFDRDGDLDLLLTGNDSTAPLTRLYRGSGGGFSEVSGTGLPDVSNAAVAWGDYDGDGYPDLLMTGNIEAAPEAMAAVYHNNGDGTFTDIGAGLYAVRHGSANWVDIDSDGDLDIFYTGEAPPVWTQYSKIYENTGGAFTEIVSTSIIGFDQSGSAWGDYDCDGDPDLLVSGSYNDGATSRIYRNDGLGMDFVDVGAGLIDCYASDVSWADIDNDGDLDVLVMGRDASANRYLRIYRNNLGSVNSAPSPPSGLVAFFSSPTEATFTWSAATDDHTPSSALSYNLMVGTSVDDIDILAPMSDVASGYRRIAAPGNNFEASEAIVGNLAAGTTYYWAVQAVDGAFAGSTFASGTVSSVGTVYVDDDFHSGTPGWNFDHFDSIQNGINSVAEGGTVHVAAGTYVENVNHYKSALLAFEEPLSIQGDFSQSTGTTTAPAGLLQVSGNWSMSGGSFDPGGGTVQFTGASIHLFSGSTVFATVEILTGATLRLLAGSNLGFAGALTVNGTLDALTNTPNTITLAGSGAQVLPEGFALHSLSILASANFSAPTALSVAGDWDNGGGFVHNDGTITFNGAGTQSLSGATSFGNVTINSGASLSLGDSISVAGDWTNGGSLAAGGHLVTFNGTATQNLSGATSFAGLTINSASTLLVGDPISVAGDWINEGQVTISENLVTFNGSGIQVYTGSTLFGPVTVEAASTLELAQNSVLQLRGNLSMVGSLDSTTNIPNSVMFMGPASRLIPSATYDNLLINDGLLGYWAFEDGAGTIAADSSGYDHPEIFYNSPTWSSDVPATQFANSGSLHFDRADADYAISTGNPEIDAMQEMTLTCWVKLDVMTPGATERFISVYGAQEKAVLRYAGTTGPGQLHFYVRIDGTLQSLRVDNALSAGSWLHVAGTYDGSVMRMYLNGAELASSIEYEGPLASGGDVRLSKSSSGEALEGSLDDVRIYDRALSLTEVAALAAGNHPTTAQSTATLAGAVDVNADLTLVSTNLDVSLSNHPITIGGDLARYGGEFLTQTGSVTFDGSGVQLLSSDAFTFGNVTVGSTVTLTTEADVTLNGTLTNLGATEETRRVSTDGAIVYGLAGITTNVTAQGALNSLQVTRVDQAHPGAVNGIQTNRYWNIEPTGSGYTVDLTLPHDSLADPMVCRYLDPTWDSGQDGFDATTVWRNGITSLSDWAVSDGEPDSLADLEITKTNGQDSAAPGESVTYTITATNNGPDPVTGATVTDTFPAALTGVSWTCAGTGGATCTTSGAGDINDTVDLPNGGSVVYTASGTISAGATGTLANTAVVAAPVGVTDPENANNSATDSDTLTPEADLAITKTDGQDTVVTGTNITYTITVSNGGPSDAPGALVTDTVPVVLTGVSWTCTGSGGGGCTASGAGDINDTVNLPSGASVTYLLSGTVDAGATGTLDNTASVAVPAGVIDPDTSNNSATDSDTILGPLVFEDGFESGDSSRWSATVGG